MLPDEDDYNNANVEQLLKEASEIGDQARVSQLLQADASIRAKACWFNVTCALGKAIFGRESKLNQNNAYLKWQGKNTPNKPGFELRLKISWLSAK